MKYLRGGTRTGCIKNLKIQIIKKINKIRRRGIDYDKQKQRQRYNIGSTSNYYNGNLTKYGKSLMNSLINGKSSKYVTVYSYDSSVDKTWVNIDTASAANYAKNTKIYGDGIRETSTAGTGKTSWYTDYSYFPAVDVPFSLRGGAFWYGEAAGLFYFSRCWR